MLIRNSRGGLLGIHGQKTRFFNNLREAAARGVPFPVVKLTQELTALADVKRDSPETLAVGRIINPMDGMGGIENMPDVDAIAWAARTMQPIFDYFALNPTLVQHIDVQEIINESDPIGVDGYYKLGLVMKECVKLGRARYPSIHWGIGSFNEGTPEYDEMQAFIDSGVLDEENIVLCAHEGVTGPTDNIDKGYGSLIPGATSVSEGGGSHIGRIAYFAELAGEKMIPVIVSEFYMQAYGDTAEIRRRTEWADNAYSKLWYVLGFLPFTHSPTEQWENQDYGPAYPELINYMETVRDRENTQKPEPEPEPEPMDWRLELIEESERRQAETGINYNPRFAFIKWMVGDNLPPHWAPAHKEGTYTFSNGTRWQIQGAVDLTGESERVTMAYKAPWSGMKDVLFLRRSELVDEPEPEPEAFSFKAWPTDFKTVTQTFENDAGYYSRFGLPGHEGEDVRAPSGTPVYAVADGTVYRVETVDNSNYGKQVRIDHGDGWKTIYAHNEIPLVSVGQRVVAGQQIARADNTGNIVSGTSHLHLTLKRDGQASPGWPSDIVDPTPFLLPWKPNFPGLPPSAHGLTICDVSRHNNPKGDDDVVSGPINFTSMMRRGVYGCYIRGSMGKTGLDNAFVLNWNAIKNVPIKRGMYHLWISDGLTAEDNLNNIKDIVARYGHGDLKITIDVEPISGRRIDGNQIARFLPMFKEEFGYDPPIYTGTWVLPYIDGDTNWIRTSYLWLAAYWNVIPQVNQYPTLPSGASLGNLLAHQWTSSRYNGRGWGLTSVGLDINVVYDLNRLLVENADDPVPPPPPPPPPLPKIDLLPYFMPTQARGPLYELKRESGAQERVQTHVEGDVFYYTKGTGGIDGKSEWEELTFDSDFIYRAKDTSPGSANGVERWYALRDDPTKKWSKWLPRFMSINETYSRNPWVHFFRKDNCEEISRGQQMTTIKLVAVYPTWVSPHGPTLRDVAVFEVYHASGALFERTFVAKGLGLVGFMGESVESYISELHAPGERESNIREQGCFS